MSPRRRVEVHTGSRGFTGLSASVAVFSCDGAESDYASSISAFTDGSDSFTASLCDSFTASPGNGSDDCSARFCNGTEESSKEFPKAFCDGSKEAPKKFSKSFSKGFCYGSSQHSREQHTDSAYHHSEQLFHFIVSYIRPGACLVLCSVSLQGQITGGCASVPEHWLTEP